MLIQAFYNVDLEPINLKNSDEISIRTFLFKDGAIERETYVMDSMAYRSMRRYHERAPDGLYFSPNYSRSYRRKSLEETNQRLYVNYKGMVSIIDFVGVLAENGAGHIDQMDSLVLRPGHFVVHRSFGENSPYKHWEIRTIRSYMRRGLTTSNEAFLLTHEFLRYSDHVDTSFLDHLKLPSHFIAQAEHYLDLQKPDEALVALRRALKNGATRCKTSLVSAQAYKRLDLLDSAIAELSKAIHCMKYAREDRNMLIGLYRERAQLYIVQGKLTEASRDFDAIVEHSSDLIQARNERASFYLEVTQQFEKAIFELNQIVLGITREELQGCQRNLSHYSNTYFNLGRAAYAYGLKEQAFQYWLKAAECRFKPFYYYQSVPHFDSMIVAHPNEAKLYLARALALQQLAPYKGGGLYSDSCYSRALEDLAKARSLGINDYRIYQLNAISLHSLKKDGDIEALNKAIELAPNNAKLYMLRYNYREDVGLAKLSDENDPDILKFNQLCPRWIFERF